MQAQNEFEIHVMAPVVYGMPIAIFDVESAQAYYDAVRKAAEPFDQWVLFENPQASSVMTEEAIQCVIQNYNALSQVGCIGISLQISNVIARILRWQDLKNLNIPFIASTNQIELGNFVGNLINQVDHSHKQAEFK